MRQQVTTMVNTVTDSTFDAQVLASSSPVLVEFGASWCPPCRMMAPIVESVASEREGLSVLTLDVDANPVTQARYGVLSIPTMLLFSSGRAVRQVVGYTPKGALLRMVDEALTPAA